MIALKLAYLIVLTVLGGLLRPRNSSGSCKDYLPVLCRSNSSLLSRLAKLSIVILLILFLGSGGITTFCKSPLNSYTLT